MKRKTICLAILLELFVVCLAAQPGQSVINIVDADGKGKLSFQPRPEPYKAGMKPITSSYFWDHQDLVDKDGQAVTGVAFYAWVSDGVAHVVVFTLVPAKGAPNRYLARNGDDKDALLRTKEAATLTLRKNESTSLQVMKDLGLKPFAVQWKAQ